MEDGSVEVVSVWDGMIMLYYRQKHKDKSGVGV